MFLYCFSNVNIAIQIIIYAGKIMIIILLFILASSIGIVAVWQFLRLGLHPLDIWSCWVSNHAWLYVLEVL